MHTEPNDKQIHGFGCKRTKLLVMRPYQIYAVKAIVNSIQEHKGNGYIWHTTGSGKTLDFFQSIYPTQRQSKY
jgi:type I site-specific restriction-modification system R (restriction) subunit